MMVRTIWYVANVLCLVKLVARAALVVAAAGAGGLRGYSGGDAAGMMNEDGTLN
jgi:hypothetical protein